MRRIPLLVRTVAGAGSQATLLPAEATKHPIVVDDLSRLREVADP